MLRSNNNSRTPHTDLAMRRVFFWHNRPVGHWWGTEGHKSGESEKKLKQVSR